MPVTRTLPKIPSPQTPLVDPDRVKIGADGKIDPNTLLMQRDWYAFLQQWITVDEVIRTTVP
jgi:hypothetical protein